MFKYDVWYYSLFFCGVIILNFFLLSGLWQENGPCRSDIEGKEIGYNPDTWTQFSNMIFIDQVSSTMLFKPSKGPILIYLY